MAMQYDPISGKMIDTNTKGPLDWLTRLDDIMVRQSALLEKQNTISSSLLAVLPQVMAPAQDNQDLRHQMESGEYYPYDAWPASGAQVMTGGATDQEINIQGNSIACWTEGSYSAIGVRLNRSDAPIIYFNQLNPIKGIPFWRIYLTYSVQVGKTMRLFFGRDNTNLSPPLVTGAGSGFRDIMTATATHFTGAIAQWAREDENIAGLVTNRIRITGIAIESEERLDYRLVFWSNDTFDDVVLDDDTFRSEVQLSLPSYGWQIAGAGQWYMAINGLNVEYEDKDASGEIHCSLQVLSAAGKSAAGAGGDVSVRITYEEVD